MTVVNIMPLPDWARKVPKRLRPVHHPIFTEIGPEGITAQDIALARELYELLDAESREWYGNCPLFCDLNEIDAGPRDAGPEVTATDGSPRCGMQRRRASRRAVANPVAPARCR